MQRFGRKAVYIVIGDGVEEEQGAKKVPELLGGMPTAPPPPFPPLHPAPPPLPCPRLCSPGLLTFADPGAS